MTTTVPHRVVSILPSGTAFTAHSFGDVSATSGSTLQTTSRANGVAQQSCNALLGVGLPASTGFVDKIWSTTIPKRDHWNGVLYMLGLLHVSGSFHLWY